MTTGPAFTTVFTDRAGGVSGAPYDSLNLGDHVGDDPAAVATNRALLAARVGVERIVWMGQVHSDRVAVVDDDRAAPQGVDGLVTATRGLALGVLVADCVPVLMGDAEAGVVAAVHAGRKGTHTDVVVRALEQMELLGARRDRVEVLLGPSVCGGCYEVPEAMQREVADVVPDAATTTRWGTPGLDLRAGLGGRLAPLVGSVEHEGPCTLESPDLFSYRRAAITGRIAGVILCR